MTRLLAFLAVSVVVICTPGPDTALTIRNTLAGGRRGGVWTAAGVAIGQSVWTLAASAGVAGLLRASEPAFLAVKVAGAAYLVVLGMQSLHAAWSRRGHGDAPARRASDRRARDPSLALRQGILSNLGNPKMAAFFTGLLPQFAPGGRPSFLALSLLGLVFCLLTFAWLAAYSFAVAKARVLLHRPRVRRALETLTGCVLVALGVRVAAEHR